MKTVVRRCQPSNHAPARDALLQMTRDVGARRQSQRRHTDFALGSSSHEKLLGDAQNRRTPCAQARQPLLLIKVAT